MPTPTPAHAITEQYKGGLTSSQTALVRKGGSDAVLAMRLWMRAEEQMDTRSRPPGVVRGHWGGCGLCLLLHHPQAPLPHVRSRLLPLLRRRRSTAGGCVPVHRVVPSHPVDTQSPARPPARRRDWCCSGSSSRSHRAHRMLQGSFPSQILKRLPRSKGKQVACAPTHTHTHTHMPLAHCE